VEVSGLKNVCPIVAFGLNVIKGCPTCLSTYVQYVHNSAHRHHRIVSSAIQIIVIQIIVLRVQGSEEF